MSNLGPRYWLVNLVMLAASLILVGCAGFTRHPNSGYFDLDTRATAAEYYQERSKDERERAAQQLGLKMAEEPTTDDITRLQYRVKLNRLERNLESNRERTQYYGIKPYLNTDEERVTLLSIPSYEGRSRYIQSLQQLNNIESPSPEAQVATEAGDIILGMTKKSVKESWGEPESVEVAGNPIYGNERWRYTRNIASENGTNKEARLIYFESGKVVGWEKH